MADLIDREALIAECKQLSGIDWNKKAAPVSWADAYEEFIDNLEEAPVVDAVEVVRCQYCKYKRITNGSMKVKSYSCDRSSSPCRGRIVEPSFFCPYGEKEKRHDR